MSSVEFLKPRLVGRRFDDASIPLEMLGEIAVLGELVIEVAKWRYLQANPDRQRSPRGFADRVSLKLRAVEEGSAVPVINLEFQDAPGTTAPQLPGMPFEYQQYYLEARDAIIDTISAAERDEIVRAPLPEKHLVYFDRIGRGLQEGEHIEFRDPGSEKISRLNKESRRRLVWASRISEITEEVMLRGAIPEVDQDRMTFELETYQGKVPGQIPDEYFETVIGAFNQYKASGRVSIQGLVKYNRAARPVGIEAIEDVVLLDPLDVLAQLDDLRSMDDGWLNGEGYAPSGHLLDWLAESFDGNYPGEATLPHLYPTEEGGVQAEWSIAAREVSLRFNSDNRIGEWHLMALDSDEEQTQELDFAEEHSWAWVAEQLDALQG